VIRQNWSPPCVVTTRIKNARKTQLLATYHLHHRHDVLVLALAVRKAGLLTGAGTIVSASTGSSSSTGSAHQHPGTSRGDALSFVQELRASVYGRGAGPKAKGPAL
jgi:hypothetical protein